MRLIKPSRIAASLAALAFLATTSVAQTVDNKPEIKAQVLDRVTSILSGQAYVPGLDFGKWKEFADAQKAKLDGSKDDEEFGMAVNEAFSKFGASHIALITPRYTDMRSTGSMVGIGIGPQKTEEGTLILRTIKGGAAEKAGLVPGDTITKVDGKPADGAKGIAGPEGTTLKVTVKHADGKLGDYTLTRAKFNTNRPEELVKVNEDTARLSVFTFDRSYDGANVEALVKQAAKYKNLILDLRDNPGGMVVNVQHLLGVLMPRADFGTFVDRRMVEGYVEATGEKATDVTKVAEWSRALPDWRGRQMKPFRNRSVPVYDGKIAVLINRFSGSGAEIAAAALRDCVGAQVVGTKSAGAVLVSYIDSATNGFTLEYPVMDYVTVKGLRIEGNGVEPTVKVEDAKYRIATAKDPVVEKATALLQAALSALRL